MSTAWMPESQLEGYAAKIGGFELELIVHEVHPNRIYRRSFA